MADTVGKKDIRGENIERAIRGLSNKRFRLKGLLLNQSSNQWIETFYSEDATILTAAATRNIKEVGRLSDFPNVNPSWTKNQAPHIKYADQTVISMEDNLTNAIDVQGRSLFKIAEGIANAVDAAIYAALTAETSTSGTVAAVAKWDSATVADRDPIVDLLKGIQAMDENNFDALEGGVLLITPKNYRDLLANSKVINNPSFKTADVVSNGVVGQIVGLRIVKTTSVTTDECMIIIDQRTATWKTVQSMRTAVIDDPGIKITIRAWEIGQIQISAPKAIYTVTGLNV